VPHLTSDAGGHPSTDVVSLVARSLDVTSLYKRIRYKLAF
jgi:hypothetical protein